MTHTYPSNAISIAAAKALRGGKLPHVAPPAAPVSSRVRLELKAGPHSAPEVVISDPAREDSWRAALAPAGEGCWSVEILLPAEPTLLHYHFELADGTQIRERRQAEGHEISMFRDPPVKGACRPRRRVTLVQRAVYGVWKEQDFRISVYLPEGAPPDWARGEVFYQIFPDRFARAENLDLPKRERTYNRPALHLDWDALPEKPPRGRDFYGGNLRGIIKKLDYLADLGVTCIYFTPIFESPTNHRYDAIDYYNIDPMLGSEEDFRALVDGAQARGMRVLMDGVFNHCSSESIYFSAAQRDKNSPYFRWFHFNHWPNDYLGWAGVRSMPEFVECPEVEEFFFGADGVAQHWMSTGISGWRTDVTPWLSEEFWQRFRKAVRRAYPEAFLIAEDWADATGRLLGDSFDSTMNYRFAWTMWGWAGGKLNALELDDRLETLRRDTPPTHFHTLLNLLDSHDTARALTMLGGDERRLRLAAALQFAYPGAPMIFAGDEVGQEGEYAEDSRRPFAWSEADGPLHDYYRKLIHTRRASDALMRGEVHTAWIDREGGYAFLRVAGDERVLAIFNNSEHALQAQIPLSGAPDSPWEDLLGQLNGAHVEGETLRVEIPPLCAGWLQMGRKARR